jgi:hypothetical protein
MIISRRRLNDALTPEQYIDTMNTNRERFEANVAATRITDEERGFFAHLPEPLQVLVLTEDWCGDSATNLPIVVQLARETGGLTLRILRREGNEDIADRYLLADGRNHIPTYIVHDGDLNELGHVIERPEAVTARMAPFRAAWFADHPEAGTVDTPIGELASEARERFLADLTEYRRGLWELEQREIISAFRAIAQRAFSPAAR